MSILSRREREKAERREAILTAAQGVFAAKGFAAATMDDVAAAAELSKGTLYLYFKNKDDLFIAMASCMVQQIVELMKGVASSAATGREDLSMMLSSYAVFALKNAPSLRTAIIWIATGSRVDVSTTAFQDYRKHIQAVQACLIAVIEKGMKDGSLRKGLDPVMVAARVWSAMLGGILFRINAEEVTRRFLTIVDVDEFLPGFVAMLCDGLRPIESGECES